MELSELESAVEGILFTAGEPVPAQRIALVLGVDVEEIHAAAKKLADEYSFSRRGFRLVRMDDSMQICSSPEHADVIIRALEHRKPPKLSQPALEVLAIVAYFQPVTRAYVDQVRGVDSSYTVGVLSQRGLIEACGRLDVPGRPTIYKTSDAFLRTMNISSLDELPELPDMTSAEGMEQLQSAIAALQVQDDSEQMAIDDE